MTHTIRTTYPCCGRRAVFAAVLDLPREKYTRRCVREECEVTYEVTRRTLPLPYGSRIDVLEWLDTNTRLYTRQYGG